MGCPSALFGCGNDAGMCAFRGGMGAVTSLGSGGQGGDSNHGGDAGPSSAAAIASWRASDAGDAHSSNFSDKKIIEEKYGVRASLSSPVDPCGLRDQPRLSAPVV